MTATLRRRIGGIVVLVLFAGCSDQGSANEETAQRFFRAVYGCSGESLDSLASPDVRMSYPIFEERLGTSVLEGREAVKEFSSGFCQRWSDPEVAIDKVVSGPGVVALVWSYSAVSAVDAGPAPTRSAWGGISVFELDAQGRVAAEYGEESTPGPTARMAR